MSTDLVETGNRDLAGPGRLNELYAVLIKEWGAHDNIIESTRKKLQVRRIKIGSLLLEIKQRVDAGENGDQCTFWEWFDEMVPGRSRRDAERMIEIAGSDDPEAAYQKKLEKQKEYTERHRKKLGAPSHETEAAPSCKTEAEPELPSSPKPKARYPSAEGDDDLINQVEVIFRRLSWMGAIERSSGSLNSTTTGSPESHDTAAARPAFAEHAVQESRP
jgi:hypothetical protein